MKTVKLIFLIIFFAVFTCNISWGQRIIHTEATCNLNNYDMGFPIGIVNGSIIYHFTIQLSRETGKIENLHWVAKECNITNEDGLVVKSIDAGHDTKGIIWDFFNRPNYWNEVLYSPNCTYNVEDGWWNNIMPDELPEEGTFVGMAYKFIFNGEVFRYYSIVQLHMNANGDVTADVIKP